jgi:hypothetical protein
MSAVKMRANSRQRLSLLDRGFKGDLTRNLRHTLRNELSLNVRLSRIYK